MLISCNSVGIVFRLCSFFVSFAGVVVMCREGDSAEPLAMVPSEQQRRRQEHLRNIEEDMRLQELITWRAKPTILFS